MTTGPLLAQAARLLQAGRAAEAVAPLAEAARLQPGNAGILHDLGLAWLECGRAAEAIAAFDAALVADPRAAKIHMRLGAALEAQGSTTEALAAYREAVRLMPSLTEAHYRAGNLQETTGDTAEAVASFRSAGRAKTSLGRIAMARALLLEGRDTAAETPLRQAIALDPDNPGAHDLLGTLLADAGKFDEARACYERATRSPAMAGSFYDLARCRRITSADTAVLVRMRAALDMTLDPVARLRVHLALGKAADDLGDAQEAMRHFNVAAAIRRDLVDFDPRAFDALADRVMARIAPERIARPTGCEDRTPLLIVGLPRSGTTLLEQILSSHPSVAAGGELGFWSERGAQWLEADAKQDDFLSRAAADAVAMLRGVSATAARVTDKMPGNLLWAGLIHLAFPRATILHCRRHPVATALSIHQTFFNRRLPFPTGGDELVAYVRTARRLAEHWRTVLPAGRFVDVDYESLVARPEICIRAVVAACDLPWDEACLRPERNGRIVRTASKWQARQPIHGGAVDHWRRYEPLLGSLNALRELKD